MDDLKDNLDIQYEYWQKKQQDVALRQRYERQKALIRSLHTGLDSFYMETVDCHNALIDFCEHRAENVAADGKTHESQWAIVLQLARKCEVERRNMMLSLEEANYVFYYSNVIRACGIAWTNLHDSQLFINKNRKEACELIALLTSNPTIRDQTLAKIRTITDTEESRFPWTQVECVESSMCREANDLLSAIECDQIADALTNSLPTTSIGPSRTN